MYGMRILFKFSGEALSSTKEKYSKEHLELISNKLKKLLEQKVEIGLVFGGGNLFRGKDFQKDIGVSRPTADYIGMLATIQNALVVRDYLNSVGIQTRIFTAIEIPTIAQSYVPQKVEKTLEKNNVAIFSGGLGIPYFSTDTTLVQRALQMKADKVVMVKNGVDGVYDSDPDENQSAKKIDKITASEVLEMSLGFADQTAISLAREHNLTIKVVSIDDVERFDEDDVGTIILPK